MIFGNSRQLHLIHADKDEDCELLCLIFHPIIMCSTQYITENYVKPIEKMLLISIENSYDGTILKKTNGEYASTKDNKNGGIGIKRIKEIVEQNDGIIEITDNNYIFCVHIMFPLMEKISNENSNT